MERTGFLERLIAGVSYLTYGGAGAIWFIIMHLMKKNISMFMYYHVMQSVFIFLGLLIVELLLGMIMEILNIIPFVNVVARQIYYYLNTPLYMNYSAIQIGIYTLQVYLAITALMGLYSFIPKVSNIISELIGRR